MMQFHPTFLRSVLALGVLHAVVLTPVQAQTTGSLVVSANVVSSCVISATPLAFGNYDPLSTTDKDGSGTVVVTCGVGAIPTVSLNAGVNPAGTTTRQMKDSAAGSTAMLAYDIYMPASNLASAACAYTTKWGDGTNFGSAQLLTAATDLQPRTYNVCGRIPKGQTVPASTSPFQDTVTATLSF